MQSYPTVECQCSCLTPTLDKKIRGSEIGADSRLKMGVGRRSSTRCALRHAHSNLPSAFRHQSNHEDWIVLLVQLRMRPYVGPEIGRNMIRSRAAQMYHPACPARLSIYHFHPSS